jgi:DNA repair protein RadC
MNKLMEITVSYNTNNQEKVKITSLKEAYDLLLKTGILI